MKGRRRSGRIQVDKMPNRKEIKPMETTLYIGMENKPITAIVSHKLSSNYTVRKDYFTPEGKRIMLKAERECIAYYPANEHMMYPNRNYKPLPAGNLYSPQVLERGYDPHSFSIVLR